MALALAEVTNSAAAARGPHWRMEALLHLHSCCTAPCPYSCGVIARSSLLAVLGLAFALVLPGCGGTARSPAASTSSTSKGDEQALPAGSSPAAAAACEEHWGSQPGAGHLSGAFETTGNELVTWQQQRHGPGGPQAVSDFAQRHEERSMIYVCYFDDGDYATGGPGDAPPHNRVRVLVEPQTGEAAMDTAGWHDTPGQPHMESGPIGAGSGP